MTGDAINAEEAKSLGLVNHIVSPEELMNKCKEMAKKIMTKAPLAISSIIRLANDFYEPNKDGYQNENNDFGMFFGTQDFKEGVDAFLNKRKASFVGK